MILALVIIFLIDGDQVVADEWTGDVIFIQKLLIIHKEKNKSMFNECLYIW